MTTASRGSGLADTHMRVDTDALRREHPIAELVASYGIALRRVGAALVGRCPFHQDRGRPNLHVYGSGHWICYRCDQRGDVIGFVQQIENLTFREAAARLDGPLTGSPRPPRRGPAPPLPAPTSQPKFVWRREEYRVLAAATDLYANRLLSDEVALGYMAGRGFSRELLERYRVGYANGGELIPYLRWRRLPLGAAVRIGLITDHGREFLASGLGPSNPRLARRVCVGRTHGFDGVAQVGRSWPCAMRRGRESSDSGVTTALGASVCSVGQRQGGPGGHRPYG